MKHAELIEAIATAGASIEDQALIDVVPGLAEMTGHTFEQLSIAARSPRGSLGRAWLLSMVDGFAAEASQSLGHAANWQETVVHWHRKKRAAQ